MDVQALREKKNTVMQFLAPTSSGDYFNHVWVFGNQMIFLLCSTLGILVLTSYINKLVYVHFCMRTDPWVNCRHCMACTEVG